MGTAPRLAAHERHGQTFGATQPVLLITLGVPFDPEAAAVAVDAAVETGQTLVVANVVQVPPLPLSIMMGYDQAGDPPELLAAVRAPAELAKSLGVAVELLRVRSLHPIPALLELVAERHPGLLVFGPDRARLRGRRYRKAAEAIRENVPCLVWLAPDLPA